MKAAIFDMDGTILDSMWMWRGLGQKLLERYGMPLPEEVHKLTKPMTLLESAAFYADHFQLEMTPDEVLDAWNGIIRESYSTIVYPKEGAAEYLRALRESGVRLGVATLTAYEHALPALRRHGLDELFEFILTPVDVGRDKNYPDIYFEAARRLETPPGDCVVFEDAYYAVKTATGAGFKTYAIADPVAADKEEAIRAICDRFVTSYSELLEELPR